MGASEIIKKERERFMLDQFFAALDVSARVVEEREAPDFLVGLDGREVGVELTDLFISHEKSEYLPQAQESISDNILLRAQRVYQKSEAPPAHISVCFSPRADLRKLDRDGSAAALSAFVHGLNLEPWQRAEWRPEEATEAQLPAEFSYVNMLGVPTYEMGHWGVARAGWVAPLTVEALQSRIDSKSKKLDEYHKVVAENWLVLVGDGRRPSQLFTAKNNFDPSRIASPFSRTFYYGHPDRGLIELG